MGMPFEGYGMEADTVDETASVTHMSGNATLLNQAMGKEGWGTSPTKCLVIMWFTVLGTYWAIGYFFKGQRA